jgi:hypothetical protein
LSLSLKEHPIECFVEDRRVIAQGLLVDAETLWFWVSANQDGDDRLRLTVCSNVNISLKNIEVVEISRSFFRLT